ncbi:MAG: response regulator, partial [Anaerolineae bacterium]|nr:response regulator [Anaerolineae bacterium]
VLNSSEAIANHSIANHSIANHSIANQEGVIRLATAVRTITAQDEVYWQRTNMPLSPGNYVSLLVQDTGEGMDEQVLTRLFEPFFTTRFTGRGLGLAAALGIIRGHAGGVQVVSTPGDGATLEILFPVSLVDVVTAVPPPATVARGMVLVIDDEPAVCETVVDILEMEKIEAVTAVDGEMGIAVYQQLQEQITLVLLDLSLPDMTGKEVFDRLKSLTPHIQIILTSGYSEMDAVQGFGNGLVAFLQKPYSLEDLVQIVQKHMAA